MAHTLDFFDIIKNNIDNVSEAQKSRLQEEIYCFLTGGLLDSDFDKIGALGSAGDEFGIYRELAALPRTYR